MVDTKNKNLKQVILYLTPEQKKVLNSGGNMQDYARKMIREYPIMKKELISLIGETNLKELLK